MAALQPYTALVPAAISAPTVGTALATMHQTSSSSSAPTTASQMPPLSPLKHLAGVAKGAPHGPPRATAGDAVAPPQPSTVAPPQSTIIASNNYDGPTSSSSSNQQLSTRRSHAHHDDDDAMAGGGRDKGRERRNDDEGHLSSGPIGHPRPTNNDPPSPRLMGVSAAATPAALPSSEVAATAMAQRLPTVSSSSGEREANAGLVGHSHLPITTAAGGGSGGEGAGSNSIAGGLLGIDFDLSNGDGGQYPLTHPAMGGGGIGMMASVGGGISALSRLTAALTDDESIFLLRSGEGGRSSRGAGAADVRVSSTTGTTAGGSGADGTTPATSGRGGGESGSSGAAPATSVSRSHGVGESSSGGPRPEEGVDRGVGIGDGECVPPPEAFRDPFGLSPQGTP